MTDDDPHRFPDLHDADIPALEAWVAEVPRGSEAWAIRMTLLVVVHGLRDEHQAPAPPIDAEALHRAADRVEHEVGTPAMDALAAAGAEFLHSADLTDEYGVAFVPDGPSIGYGIMLGYLAALGGLP